MNSQVTTSQDGRVVTVTLSNPPHALMTMEMVAELDVLVRRWETDDSVGAVIITGSDPVFLSHFDVGTLLQIAKDSPKLSASQARVAFRSVRAAARVPGGSGALGRTSAAGVLELSQFHDLLLRMGRSGVAFIAAINGSTAGGGCEFALACDFRLMELGDNEIAQPEIVLGFPPGGGGTQRLARLLGTGRALELALGADPVTAERAAEIGLITKAVPPGELMNEARTMAERLSRRSKPGIRSVKRAIRDGGSLPLEQGITVEAGEFLAALTTQEALTLMTAYVGHLEHEGILPALDPNVREQLVDGTFEPIHGESGSG